MSDLDIIDPLEYIQQKEEYEEKREDFMRKHLRRAWPIRIVRAVGLLQLIISLALLGVDLPIVLMFAPRWQIFAGCWTFIFGFVACVSTLHSTRKMTWLKLKWAVAFNILAGIAAAVTVAFNILYSVNPYICIIVGGCSYLTYTYSIVKSYYTGEIILGIALLITAFIFLVLFIKYGIGGTTLFDDVEKGWVPDSFRPVVPPNGTMPGQQHPTTGPGAMVNRPPNGTMLVQQYPITGPGVMMSRPLTTGPMMMPRYPPPPGAMMMPRYPPPPGSMMMLRYPPPPGSMMMPGPNGPIPAYPGQPGPYPAGAYSYQN